MKNDNLNLYIDESGSGNILSQKPKFFLMASIVMNESEEKKAQAFFSCWKKKYTMDHNTSFHSTDFFEDNRDRKGNPKVHRKRKLNDFKHFAEAVKELLNIIKYLKFSCNVYYVNLERMRKRLGLGKKEKVVLKDIINKEYDKEYLYPIYTVSRSLYQHHENELIGRIKYPNKSKRAGFVCYESQKENDMKIVQSFHEYLQQVGRRSRTYIYGKTILGINFYTKASLCSAVELADFFAYSTHQYLRSLHAKNELTSFNVQRLKLLLATHKSLTKFYKIKIIDVTNSAVEDYEKLRTKVQSKKKCALKTKKASAS